MRERVQELGGSLSLESSRGTRLQIELPQSVENTGVALEVLEP
jgi:glucose-6-phosphate-specific signal transduction histidine kinase